MTRNPTYSSKNLLKACLPNVSKAASEDLMASLSQQSRRHNEVIYLQDEDAERLYVLLEGYVRLSYMMEDGSAVLYGIVGPGTLFGELGVFDGGRHCDMATSVGACNVGSVSAPRFHLLCEQFPELRNEIAMLVAQRYRSYIELMRLMSLRRLSSRVSCALLRIADTLNQHTTYEGADYLYVSPIVTQTDLAVMARGSRGNINRTLKAWERAGWVLLANRTILIKDRQALETLVFEDEL